MAAGRVAGHKASNGRKKTTDARASIAFAEAGKRSDSWLISLATSMARSKTLPAKGKTAGCFAKLGSQVRRERHASAV